MASGFEEYRKDIRDLFLADEICPPAMMEAKIKEKLELLKPTAADPVSTGDGHTSIDGTNVLPSNDSVAESADLCSKY